ncbi:hpch/hpai aldolase [Steroidobacter agaridevorans]|uniref:Hpch/hpai aldolase n=1 Tax=Steroidobacter agaridevorans TaxID=2695856 RepID=A0A829Y822_9GAMM|nr:aldolase/citrate lyase family protein [Steroidobacter agaridevorans]GFE79427.1 hpch/hpai aldolase [Steroidobacter agaridevorans]GFE88432.1 hpch/hpai aldolase [Steroidobacter agaridevorans]
MSELPRLNGIIKAWEQGRPAYASFAPPGRRAAIEFSSAPYDAVVFEMEHNSWDAEELEVTLQFMLNRKQILESGSLAPTVTPIVRIPANGVENNQWLAKQALDRGVYGVVWPHVSTVEQAYNAVSACRYPRPKDAPYLEPIGMRGDGPHTCSRYWGLTQQQYYSRADVWPLNPQGEVLVFLMIEDVAGVQNLDDILRNVPGIGCVLIGEGDLSQELGVPRQYEHPIVKEAMGQIVATCKKHGMRVGHPHVTSKNVESVVAQGYSFLMSSPVKTYGAIEKARQLAGG